MLPKPNPLVSSSLSSTCLAADLQTGNWTGLNRALEIVHGVENEDRSSEDSFHRTTCTIPKKIAGQVFHSEQRKKNKLRKAIPRLKSAFCLGTFDPHLRTPAHRKWFSMHRKHKWSAIVFPSGFVESSSNRKIGYELMESWTRQPYRVRMISLANHGSRI